MHVGMRYSFSRSLSYFTPMYIASSIALLPERDSPASKNLITAEKDKIDIHENEVLGLFLSGKKLSFIHLEWYIYSIPCTVYCKSIYINGHNTYYVCM
jgi:hypothetical protein